MFSINANTMYSFDENGEHSIEISYADSDGVNVGAYAAGDTLEEVLSDVFDQIDEAIAEYNDDQADVEESETLKKQIAELQAQIAESQAQIADLQARNDELEKRHTEKLSHKPALDDDLKTFINNFRKNNVDVTVGKNKVSDFPFSPWWRA